MISTAHRLLVVAALAAAIPTVALSQATPAKPAKPPSKTGAFGQGKGKLLTREELRSCMAQQARIREQNEAATREREALEKEKADIVQGGQALKDQLATLDRTNQEAVTQYNEAVAARDKRIDAFEARMPEFNGKVEALQKEREAFSSQCDNRRYDEDDEIAIRKGK
jgi:predicted RNase H-like nuclease (RuvC/YqgF family)